MAIKAFGSSARTRTALHNDRDTELLRSELFSLEQLKRHAVTLAGQHRVDPRPGPDRLLPRLADNARVLLAAYDVVTAVATQGQTDCTGRGLVARQFLPDRAADHASAPAPAARI
jgi:cyclic beta-1,2-glucan synthetase